jgi:hypothetical protein
MTENFAIAFALQTQELSAKIRKTPDLPGFSPT